MSTKKYSSNLARYPMAIIILALAMSSCKKDFLDKTPETSIGAGSFFGSEADLNLYAYNMYDFPSTNIYTDEAYTMTDNAWTTGNVELKTMMRGNPNSSTITSGWDWGQLRKVNFFLAHFRKAKITQPRLDHFEGLGRFFR